MRIVYHHGHALKAGGHGGNRRALQLLELLGKGPTEVESRTEELGGDFAWNLASGMRGVLAAHRPPWRRYGSVRGLKNFGAALRIEKRLLDEAPAIHLFDTRVCVYEWIIPALHSRGSKLVFLPHNLDALSSEFPNPVTNVDGPAWLADEMRAVGKAAHVYAISREEQWLMGAHGVDSTYLPYQPTQDVLRELRAIRERRSQTHKDVVLVLGSATNAPTLRGMEELARKGEQLVRACGSRKLVVAGFGTDRLRDRFPAAVEVLGGVSDSALEELLARAHAGLVYQKGASGVLTRITELGLAGVPVIANAYAARSFHSQPGIRIVESLDEMIQVLATEEAAPFEVEVPDLQERFWKPLIALQGGSSE